MTATSVAQAVIEADPALPIIRITRDFTATPAQLHRAHTDPHLFARWVGPNGTTTEIITWDARDGGEWRYVARLDGEEYRFRGCFHQVTADRIVQTFTYEAMPDDVALETLWFEDLGEGRTRLHAQSLVDSFEGRDAWLASGMESGVNDGYAKLDELLADVDTPLARYRRVAGRFDDRVSEVAPPQWDDPAPCEGWVARDVVAHLCDWVPAVVGRSGVAFEAGPSAAQDPVGAWAALHRSLEAALADPATARVEFDAGPPGRLTVEQAIDRLVTGDILVHTWDLARAAGLDDTIDEHLAAEQLAGMEPIDELLRSSGHYGPRVEVPADARVQDKLIAFTGRRP